MVSDAPLAITVTAAGLSIAGEIDVATAPTLRTAIGAAIAVADRLPILLDMSEVSFIDSSGVSALVMSQRRSPGAVRIVTPSRAVTRILDITGMSEYFMDMSAA
ncbi:MAG: anti-sigma factor antagonist [Actinomycetota bacterium]|jgi:anti-sigma B factor antagonist